MRIPVTLARACVLAAAVWNPANSQTVVEEIHVTGTPLKSRPDELAQSVTVLRDETLDRIRATNLGETLSGQLGVSASYFGAGASRPIIRGLAGARVRTMEDGIDSLDVSSLSIDHAVTIDPIVAEQIEIFRGPTTLLYGSGAVGGVINTVTTRIPEDAPAEGLDGRFELRGDSVADDRAVAAALNGGGERIAWHFDGLTREAGDYAIPGFADVHGDEDPGGAYGVLENSDLTIDSMAAGVSRLGDAGFFGASVSRYETNYGVPGHHDHADEGTPAQDPELVRIDLEQTRLDLKGSWLGVSPALQAVNLRVGVNDYEHVELEGGVPGTRYANDAWEGRVEFMHAPWQRWSGAFGMQLSDREFAAIGVEAFVPPVATRSYGAFMIEQLETQHWSVSVGARAERVQHSPSNGLPARSRTAGSVSLAGVRTFDNGLSLAINGARSGRIPAAEELYSAGPHLASGTIEFGDPDLATETATHFDVGIRGTRDDLTWSVTGFLTRYTGFIYLRDTGAVDPVEDLPIFNYDQHDAEFHGIEAEIFTPVARLEAGEIDLRVYGDFVAAALVSGENLPRIPPLRLGARLQYHNERVLAGLEVTRYAAQRDLAPFETPTAGYTMLNLDLNRRIDVAGGRALDVFLRGTNLLDEEARRHASVVKDVAPLPGRNFSVGVRLSL
jgi:iron complex outermembrane receptor protein